MKLDEILDRHYHNRSYNDHSYAKTDILNWIKERLPKEDIKKYNNEIDRFFRNGWNAYRQQTLKNLGTKEVKH